MERTGWAALPLVALAVLAVLAITIRSEAVPGQLEAATPVPDAEFKQQCIEGVAVGSGNDGLAGDCALLLAARDTLRGAERLNWSAETAIASWEGITVGGSPSRVTRLWLDKYSGRPYGRRLITLTGSIPAALGGLSKLEHLTLTRHELTGTIPAELAHLSELTDLQLHGNELTGGIPPELANLANLGRIGLSGNPLSGAIPIELGKLSNLRALSLENTQLTGSIPASLGDLPNLNILRLYGNTMLTGCIPASLRGITLNDLGSLGLEYCTTTATHALTTSVAGNGGISPLAGTYSYLSGASVTVTATPDTGYRVTSWGGDCSTADTAATCTLTLDADKTASVTFERITYALAVTVTGTGTVTPDGTTTHDEDAEVTLTASWDDATHDFAWGGDCSDAATATTCVLTMDGAKTVTATFTALGPICTHPADLTCIRIVYEGAPGDYAQISDIPASVTLTPGDDGRYYVERGQQVTVVTAAQLPAGWTRFYLVQTPLEFGTPSPVSASQLIPPVGTTYTFTVTTDDAAATLITFDLTAAKPHPVRPTHKPVLGDVVVTTVFSVATDTPSYSTYDTTGAVATAGSYAFLSDPDDTTTAVTTYEALRDGTTTALLIHESDAHGALQTALYDAVEASDLFEWHEADDCFVRYQVTDVKPDPAGAVARKLLAVEWMTYAFTGCSGAVPVDTLATIDWAPSNIQSPITIPIRHGPWQLVPNDWTGARENTVVLPAQHPEESYDVAAVRRHRLWREPDLPPGWRLRSASLGYEGIDGVIATYVDAEGYIVLTLQIQQLSTFGRVWSATTGDLRAVIVETRIIDGHPAYVRYSPNNDPIHTTMVRLYNRATGVEYLVLGGDPSISGGNIDAAIEIARSLYGTAGQ